MGRPPSFDSNGIKKGAWSKEEDLILSAFVHRFGHSNWRLLPVLAGLARCGKSCRLRWVNYLKPGVKRGNFSKEEEDLIIKLHEQVGNKWSIMASKLPGRTDNDIKNYWHAHIQKHGRRNATASRKLLMAAQTPQEDQSFCDQINNSFITTDNDDNHHKEESVFDNVSTQGLSAENIDALMNPINEQGQGGVWTETYDDQTCFSQLSIDVPPFKEEAEFYGFGLGQNDIMSTFSDSSDGGITSWNSSTAESDQVSAENIDALMNPINEQGQGGVWTETYDDQTCFSQLSIDVPPFKEEAEFYGFGLSQNDIMSTFSDSSDGGITSWNSSTAESDQVGDFWSELLFGEDSLHDIWCFGDDDMNMFWH